jgi:hypothetical protein
MMVRPAAEEVLLIIRVRIDATLNKVTMKPTLNIKLIDTPKTDGFAAVGKNLNGFRQACLFYSFRRYVWLNFHDERSVSIAQCCLINQKYIIANKFS